MAAASAPALPPALDALVTAHSAVVMTKSKCTYCTKARALLQAHLSKDEFADVHWLDVEADETNLDLFLAAAQVHGRKLVPMIWLRQEYIGGFSDLEKHLLSPAAEAEPEAKRARPDTQVTIQAKAGNLRECADALHVAAGTLRERADAMQVTIGIMLERTNAMRQAENDLRERAYAMRQAENDLRERVDAMRQAENDLRAAVCQTAEPGVGGDGAKEKNA